MINQACLIMKILLTFKKFKCKWKEILIKHINKLLLQNKLISNNKNKK